jgi:hypothetical protein
MGNLNELKHYHDLQREAEQDRLAHQALEGRPKNHLVTFPVKVWCKGFSWLGLCLSAWGKHLQEHYGTMPATPTLVQRHSD